MLFKIDQWGFCNVLPRIIWFFNECFFGVGFWGCFVIEVGGSSEGCFDFVGFWWWCYQVGTFHVVFYFGWVVGTFFGGCGRLRKVLGFSVWGWNRRNSFWCCTTFMRLPFSALRPLVWGSGSCVGCHACSRIIFRAEVYADFCPWGSIR